MNEEAQYQIAECKRTKAKSLDLSLLKLTEIPHEINELVWLEELDLDSNEISEIEGLEKLTALTELSLFCNQISEIKGLEELTALKGLVLSSNKISEIKGLEKLSALKTLVLSSNQISEIKGLEKLTALTTLSLDSNQISELKGLEKLTALTELYLSSNQINEIKGLEELTALTGLYLNSNQISEIKHLDQLTQLGFLNLQNNKIEDLTKAQIYFEANKLALVWKEEFYSYKDKGINLYGNPIKNPPITVVQKGKQSILEWFKNLDKGKQPFNEGRVILIGEGASGKTSLVDRIVNDKYEEGRNTTHGVNLIKWQLPNHSNIKVNFWDFGGQQIQRAVHKFFLTTACLYIVVCDNRKEDKPQFWLEHIKTLARSAKVILVYNKADEGNRPEFSNDFLKDKYPNIINFYRLSCKESGVDMERFKQDLEQYITKLKSVIRPYPSNYLKIKKQIEEETQLGKNYISLKRYQTICNENDLETDSGKTELLGLLNILGTITYFDDLPVQNLQVLNPEWLTSGVYHILTHKITERKKGEITVDDFDEILKPDDQFKLVFSKVDHYYYLVVLMKRFGICYTNDDKHLLIPAQFEDQMLSNYSEFRTAANYRLYFVQYKTFLPKSIITQFITNNIDKAFKKRYWSTGIEIKDTKSNTFALIEEDSIEERINVFLKGQNVLGFWQHIYRQLAEFSDFYDGIEYDEMVMLEEKSEINKNEKYISYQQLENAFIDGETNFYDSNLRMKIDVVKYLSYFKDENELKERFGRKDGGILINNSPHFVQKTTQNVEVNQTTNVNFNITIENLTKAQGSFEDILDKLRELKIDDTALLNKGDEVLEELLKYDESNKEDIAENISLKNKLKRFSEKFLDTVKTTKTIFLDAPNVAEFFMEKIEGLLKFAKELNDLNLIDNLHQLKELLNGEPFV